MLKRSKLAAAIILITLTSTGCATRTEYQLAPLPMPPRPELPRLDEADMECLSEQTYYRLIRRDRARRNYADELEAVIRSTHMESTHMESANGR